MTRESGIYHEPHFQQMLAIRARWRWTLSGVLIGVYFAYCLAGIYFTDAFAKPAFGSSVSWSIALGYGVILLAIVLSILYIRVTGRLLDKPSRKPESSP